jgi:hypothetical protein
MLDFRKRPNATYKYEYHVRHSDEDERKPSTIEKHVVVNHYRRLWFAKPLEAVETKGYMDLDFDQQQQVRKRQLRR